MTIKATWPVRHRCGHHVDWDLAHKPPAERVGFAGWLARRDCTRCWWAKRRTPDRKNRAATGVKPRAEQPETIEVWEAKVGMPDLEGSDKAVSWARRIRYRRLQTARREIVHARPGEGDDVAVRFHEPARRIPSAQWWIDQRHTDPNTLEAQLADPDPGDFPSQPTPAAVTVVDGIAPGAKRDRRVPPRREA